MERGTQIVELDGKKYEVVWSDGRAVRAYVLTKKGPRTLNGHGRAYRPELINKVLAVAEAQSPTHSGGLR